jgi:bifunctional non-homologous end joining protein LigD
MPDADGAPATLPAWLTPELATLTKERFSDPAWIFERKLDGERCLAYAEAGHKVWLMSRSQHQITSTFPEIAEALTAQQSDGFIVDGEIVAFEGDETRFERLQQRLGVARPGDDLRAAVPVYYYLFDVLYADGKDVRPLPVRDRKRVLGSLLKCGSPSTGTPTARRTTRRPAAAAGKGSSPSGPAPPTAAAGPGTG